MKVGILGAGNIAGTMAATLRGMKAGGEDVELYAVASRSQDKAEAFAQEQGVQKAFGSYADMLKDDGVDLVYVATPHSHHAEHMKLCIEHGKAILCEKSFTGNARQAEEILNLAEQKRIPLTEAIWTRYQPARKIIDDVIASGKIGEVKLVTSALCYGIKDTRRIHDPALAGGALLDLGVYVLNFASMILGTDIRRMESSVQLLDSGMDAQETITLFYPNGVMANLMASVMAFGDRDCYVMGTEGWITTDNVNNPVNLVLHKDGKEEILPVPEQITGYEYEVRACQRMLAEGKLECEEMPHAETLRIMKLMDSLRKDWGVRYPFD